MAYRLSSALRACNGLLGSGNSGVETNGSAKRKTVGLELVVPALRRSIPRGAVAAALQLGRAVLGGNSVLLLVSDALGDYRGHPHRDRLLRDRGLVRRTFAKSAAPKRRRKIGIKKKTTGEKCRAGRELDRSHHLRAAVRLRHLAGIRRRAVAQGRPRPAARMGTGRPALWHGRHLVPGRWRPLHGLYLHCRAG